MANLRIAELDFDQIKLNLKTFLQNQSEFSDYDFEGSGLSVLLDILAYNTHYNAYLANMLVNEMFLDSAVKRSSAVSLAKHLGYTPASARGARATVNILANSPAGLPTTLTLNRYTPFTTQIDGIAYTFLNITEKTISPVAGVYTFSDVEIIEGSLVNNIFVSAQPGPTEKFELTDADVDTSTILVTVQNSTTDLTTETYTLSTDITGIDSGSRVFFLEENPTGKYQIFFGDGVLGKILTVGNIIRVSYLSVSGSAGNVSDTITQSFTVPPIGGSSSTVVTTTINSHSGTEKETISSIKFKAPRVNAARNRAVTVDDYKALISANFSDAESISVWGGEDNDPPIYGKVLVSLKPFDGFIISQSTKDTIKNQILSSKKVLAIQAEFVDPEYFYVNLTVNITYNNTITTKTSSEIQNIVRNTISTYFTNELQKFDKDFNKAKLSKLILESDQSIVGVIILLKLQKRLNISLNTVNSFSEDRKIKFENGIVPGSLTSSRFFVTSNNTTVLARMTDIPSTMPPSSTGSGAVSIRNATTGSIIVTEAGTVDYGTGIVNINSFTPTALPNNITDFRITASVQEAFHNLTVYRNQILVLDETTLDALAGREAGLTVNVSTI